ncbi:MAG: hypothetical protein IMW89_12895, partial [Ktedonobacteraceae bacterium]|nr:hypothetical protein [Ktedonobacteraceae bacterium]
GTQYAPPASSPLTSAVAGSGLGIGIYKYLVTYFTQDGETTAGPATSVTTTTGNQQVSLTNIPVAPMQAGRATSPVIGRNLYRTQADGNAFFLLTTMQDNTTTTYSDTLPDSSLAGMPQPPAVNTSGVMVWPPHERAFTEQSNLYDSSIALAPGGNAGLAGAGTAGAAGMQSPHFTLALSAAELPTDDTLVMRVLYVTKHRLDSTGSTIPAAHRDIIVLGAVAHAMAAYQVPTNDNFAFQDGSLHDHIDDTHIPTSWLTTARERMRQFEARLSEIKQQRDFASSARAQWGDIPAHWIRL